MSRHHACFTASSPAPAALSRWLWQAFALALLAVALPPLAFGEMWLGAAAAFWVPAMPGLALLTLHGRSAWLQGFGQGKRGQTPFPPVQRGRTRVARGKWGLTPAAANRARRAASVRAA